MAYNSPEQRAALQRIIQLERSRGRKIYHAALCWVATGESAQEEQADALLDNLYEMLKLELEWRRERGLPVPKWPHQAERQMLAERRARQDET